MKANPIRILVAVCLLTTGAMAQTRLLRQPALSASHVTYIYGADVWISDINGASTLRLTSTPAVESLPHISPDGKWVAFTSNRTGVAAVYIVSVTGGEPKQLTWHPSGSYVKGWTPDGKVLYASSRDAAPAGYDRLWTVSPSGGPSSMLFAQWATKGSFSPDGQFIAIDRMNRWDEEWRSYRGGQNTPLVIVNLKDLSETKIPNPDRTFDIQPCWIGNQIFFLSDRDGISNIWSYTFPSGELKQITTFTGSDVKWLSGNGNTLVFERDGYLSTISTSGGQEKRLLIQVVGDFPWAETKWEDITKSVRSVSLSPTGKRAVMESRGEIFTVPVEFGDARNLTQSSGVADHSPVWSPKGDQIAWFSDAGGNGYSLMIGSQDGLTAPRSVSIGDSKLGWEPVWSPDGKYIAFDDNKVRIVVLEVATGIMTQADVGGVNIERGDLGLAWSPDSQWLAYAKSGRNNFRQVMVWSAKSKTVSPVTNSFADSFSPVWDRDGRHLYFLASTEVALGSGWANTSSMTADPSYTAWVVNLRQADPSPFKPKSDEETAESKGSSDESKAASSDKKSSDKDKKNEKAPEAEKKPSVEPVQIDLSGIDRRIMALPLPAANYVVMVSGPAGSVFIGERKQAGGMRVHKFTIEKQETKEYLSDADMFSVSADGKKMISRSRGSWKVTGTEGPAGGDGTPVSINLRTLLNRQAEWKQIFEEAWRYERDYFYDPNMHGRNWNEVHDRYAPLVPFIRHRADLTYILDMMNGELSVGHSFVFGGDFPEVDKATAGMPGANLVADGGRWKVSRIFTTESWNPELSSPLDRPGIKIKEGDYIVGVNGRELRSTDDPYQFFDGTADRQTVIHINKTPEFAGSWQETIKPIRNEDGLRMRAWVEDNRRLVDQLSGGKLAYVWVPNTSFNGFVSFNRYYFAQQDKLGAVIDERFNGGGLLDDYMVDLMNRRIRAALTNEVVNGVPFRLPAGILGPKVLLINELAGSGGDFFPWVFRQQKTGPLIGARTWGGLVKSSVHYAMVDGGALTAPDNAVFDPVAGKWIAENEGVPPDVEVYQDAKSLSAGKDPQLERAVQEALSLLQKEPARPIVPPPFSTPAKKK